MRRACSLLGSGPVVKTVMKFSEAFWEDKAAAKAARSDEGLRDAAFLHDPDAAFPTWWTARPLRVPVLTGWAAGPKALTLSGLPERAIIDAALGSLAELFGRRARLNSLLERAHCYDWLADPFARGAYSFVMVGGGRARSGLAAAIEDVLFFAGEASDNSGQASTVAGALSSGQRAAREVLDAIEK
jgi:monoamine oxidase